MLFLKLFLEVLSSIHFYENNNKSEKRQTAQDGQSARAWLACSARMAPHGRRWPAAATQNQKNRNTIFQI